MQDITRKNFEAELVNASLAQPVLLDIWAEWCGPCKALGPVLEKLETDYAGRFKLVKLDADAEPEIAQQLSQMFGVRSIPFCVLFRAASRSTASSAPCPRPRSASSSTSTCRARTSRPPQEQLQEAEELLAEGDSDAAIDRLQAALATNPANDAARYDYLRALLAAGRVDEARKAFDPVANAVVPDPRLAAAGHWLAAMEAAPAARADGRARRRDRREQARLRRPLRAGAGALRPQRVHPGDGRAARDRDARQGLEGRPGAQELRRHPRDHEQARGAPRPRPRRRSRARSRSPARWRRRRPTRWSTPTGAS